MAQFTYGDSDHVASDDLESVLEYTRQVHASTQRRAHAGSSSSFGQDHDRYPSPEFGILGRKSSDTRATTFKPSASNLPTARINSTNSHLQNASTSNASVNVIQSRITQLDAEVQGCRADIVHIEQRIAACLKEKNGLEGQLAAAKAVAPVNNHDAVESRNRMGQANRIITANGKGKAKATQGINYSTEQFDWSDGLKTRMRAVFGIREFRLCQQGVCNANMDGRDIVCIMPTGGGKSLTYQLPALLTPGCTLVISPLISLMTDQILHLREANVEAVMITSGTPKPEKERTLRRLKMLAERSPVGDKEIKLAYVTPERMSKDKAFRSLLQRVDEAKKLARIVIDEAHCVSQLGHDFRPDYKELHILRKIFPRVPIMALSATCGPQVLRDLIKILGLGKVVDGNDSEAPTEGTVYFSSPLYRKNLHYRVLPKSDNRKEQFEAMKTYILEHHPDETGIIYCLSRKDTEEVAETLRENSGGRIKTGVYHSEVGDLKKERLHIEWREGRIKVVCATIAFGMGIDKGDVRFVLHHSISKSLEGFYQESGRAGRDGKDSDCVLYYRPQDASTMAGTAASETDGGQKLHAMLDFAEELRRCRKVQFAEYFSHSSQLSVASWATDETGALEPCGHCDNCTRPAGAVERRDVTLAAWQLLKIVHAVRQNGGRLSLGMLATLARGGAACSYEVAAVGRGRNRKAAEKCVLNLEEVAGGKVELRKLDVEHLIVYLITHNYFKEEYQVTAYRTNVHIGPGDLAGRLCYHTHETIVAGSANVKLELDFLKPTAKKHASKKKGDDADNAKEKGKGKANRKGKDKEKATTLASSESDFADGDDHDDDDMGEYALIERLRGRRSTRGSGSNGTLKRKVSDINSDEMYASDSLKDFERFEGSDEEEVEDDDEGELFDWSYSMREEPKAKRRRKSDAAGTGSKRAKGKEVNGFTMNVKEGNNEVMVLSSD